MNLFFMGIVFLSPEIDSFFFGNRQQSNARAGQKKHMFFCGNARPKSNARAHLKQKKNIYQYMVQQCQLTHIVLCIFSLHKFFSSINPGIAFCVGCELQCWI